MTAHSAEVKRINSRAKGRKGETDARLLLESRDYTCEDLSAGKASCDLVAFKDGIMWAVEVKDCVSLDIRGWRAQAIRQAQKRTRWMLLMHIPDTRSWLVLRQSERPCVWHEGCDAS